MDGRFADWLEDALERHNVSRRGLARRMAENAAGFDADPDTYRRNISRILARKHSPQQPTRNAIQKALNDWTAPSEADEDSDDAITHEIVLENLDEMIEVLHHQLRRLRRYRKFVVKAAS